MSLRIFSAIFIFALASCGGPPDSVGPAEPGNVRSGDTGTPAGDPGERIACAVGSAPLSEVCMIDRTPDGADTIVTVRHPDGGFRRLRQSASGQITAADGALPAAVSVGDGVADITLGDARYRLPLARP